MQVSVSSYHRSIVIEVTWRGALAIGDFQVRLASATTGTVPCNFEVINMQSMPWNDVRSVALLAARVVWRRGRIAALFAVMLLAAGCSVMQPNVRAPQATEPVAPSPPVAAPAPTPPPVAAPRVLTPVPAIPVDETPKVESLNRGAPNAPYVIDGERYAPFNEDVSMTQVGVASWYGKPFHGRKTANGEIYNMHRMTAAHKTMPLPSYALVRHRVSGKEIIVRVNDRGPFIHGRVIDLSYAAAQALGIQGVGPVDVVRLTHEAIRLGTWRTPSVMALRASTSSRATVAKARRPTVVAAN